MSEQPWRAQIEQGLRQAVQQIAERYDPAQVFVFGSLSRGDTHGQRH
jgi:predicted nucleotidyltransferase